VPQLALISWQFRLVTSLLDHQLRLLPFQQPFPLSKLSSSKHLPLSSFLQPQHLQHLPPFSLHLQPLPSWSWPYYLLVQLPSTWNQLQPQRPLMLL